MEKAENAKADVVKMDIVALSICGLVTTELAMGSTGDGDTTTEIV